MTAIVLLLIVGLAVCTPILVVVGQRIDPGLDVEAQSGTWRRATGEVISVLRTHSRTFVLVRYPVGTSLIQNHVAYPHRGAMPRAGQRIRIKYDASSPARVEFDLSAQRQVLTDLRRNPSPSQSTDSR